jgi:tRNA nucleotidyltransferase (CCA-adding enzyme)
MYKDMLRLRAAQHKQFGDSPAQTFIQCFLDDAPAEVQYIISTLENNGHEAYAVGGCVRDSLLGNEPKDWDVCTSAQPALTMKCFESCHIIETGLKHGTITLMLNHKPFEITTYRVDGAYADNRRPDSVEFTGDLRKDLSRRDFTVNARAYNPGTGIVDFFNGAADLQRKIIRCVGDADKRFQEDALRIMRALRFASALNFSIEENTAAAIYGNKKLLRNIAAERIANELNRLIIGRNAGNILLDFSSVIYEIIPELKKTAGFQQNNPYHHLDVWNHTVTSVLNAPADVALRLTMLFHDIAKPGCYTETDGTGHFYGHPQISADMAEEILLRLKYDNNTIKTVTQLILYHDTDIKPEKKDIKRWLRRIGEERFRQLIEVKRADAKAQSEKYNVEKLAALCEMQLVLNRVIEDSECFSLKDLAVNGNDLVAAGIPEGVAVGGILNQLMNKVIDEAAENNRAKLLDTAEELYRAMNKGNTG